MPRRSRVCRRLSTLASLTLVLAIAPPPARAESQPRPTPLTGLGEDLVEVFRGWGLFAFGMAGVGTAAMVWSGLDHGVQVFSHDHLQAAGWGKTSYFAGYALPVLVPAALYGAAIAEDHPDLWNAAAATTQALGIALAMTGVLKLATGRAFPTHGEDPNDPNRFAHDEYARDFRPFQGWWAWPSGHSAGSFAIAAVLTGYYPDHLWVPLLTYPLAATISCGMVAGEYHWASDMLAGALLGQTVGFLVGRAFRNRAAPRASGLPPVLVLPTADSSALGITIYSLF